MNFKIVKLSSIGLSFALFLSMGSSTSAAAANVEDQLSINNQTDQNISDAKISEILDISRQVADEYKQSNVRTLGASETKQVIDYYRIEEDKGYFYEITPDQKESLTILDLEDVEQNSTSPSANSLAAANTGLPDGIGGRAVIRKNGSYLNTTVRTATASQMGNTANGIAWTYSGFSGTGVRSSGGIGSVEADMGLQYSKAYGYVKWTPHIGFSNGDKKYGDPLTGYDKLQYRNGFVEGSDVNFSVYRNINNNTRLSQSGYGVCADMNCTNTADTYLTSILEVASTKVSSVSQWKVLATIAGSESVTGKNYARFSNINIDGVPATPIVDQEDYANITVSGNSATISVSR
ncbi:YrpD family protein [Paenibacillus sp. Z6-24]